MNAIEDLLKASRDGKPLAINHPDAGRRVMAEVFATPTGIAFVDAGWTDVWLSRSPFHLVEGELVEEWPGSWLIDGGEMYVIPPSDGETLANWDKWIEWRDGEGASSLPTRERALALVRADIAPDARDLDEPHP